MSKLFHAQIVRIFKTVVFRICLAVAVLMSVGIALDGCLNPISSSCAAQTLLFQILPYMSFICAALIGMFIGAEYGDGTIRNKIIVGHKRSSVYVTSFLASSIASCTILAASLAVCAAISVPVLGVTADVFFILYTCLCSLFICIGLSAFFTLIGMAAGNRAGGVALCFALGLVLLLCGSILDARLQEPKTLNEYTVVDEAAQVFDSEESPNPLYVDGEKRVIFQLLCDVLPTGQAAEISQGRLGGAAMFIPLSVAFSAICTVCGLVIFSRKDLK